MRMLGLITLLLILPACASSKPVQQQGDVGRGLASWYGQEYAGRTTANGEIFDPLKLTAAHRTLPFGTILEVRNPANGQSVEVRINDRGPFIGNRVIDLSYGAAQRIDMLAAGVAEVEFRVLRMGAGEREAPRPLVVTTGSGTARAAGEPPPVVIPLPSQVSSVVPQTSRGRVEEVDVEVETIRGGVVTRKTVAQDGRTIVDGATGAPLPAVTPRRTTPAPVSRGFVLQLGAFQANERAEALAAKVRPLAAAVYIEAYRDLHRVRVGPFSTRAAAEEMKERLERGGIEAMVLTD
jgi:rare lipoprotein A